MNEIAWDAFPNAIEKHDPVWIEMPDGARLAATIWRPKDSDSRPVPAILEYVPYRRHDFTALGDSRHHPWFAGQGYASVRVDCRGSGDSDGIMYDEYLARELQDGADVIAWLAKQPWCSGSVGMMGISWGGFNALQVAALNPPALKAIITCCSTDDRYADDIHYMGGCHITEQLNWASTMFGFNSRPPDPAVVGERWRDMWIERLEKNAPWILEWTSHQRRDAHWTHGSVCEDFAAIRCAVYAVGGWSDGYSNAIPRLLAGLSVPRKGLIGPWGHNYPWNGRPGPAIGGLQDFTRWWDHWLKDEDSGMMDEPMLRAWLHDLTPPAPQYAELPGRWVAEETWPTARIAPQTYVLGDRILARQATTDAALTTVSPQTVGMGQG
ncbi:MAG: CocE/NonD family hydrolase, partial [Alphaproteobacteria bacterium]